MDGWLGLYGILTMTLCKFSAEVAVWTTFSLPMTHEAGDPAKNYITVVSM